jgi:hypothetical protein
VTFLRHLTNRSDAETLAAAWRAVFGTEPGDTGEANPPEAYRRGDPQRGADIARALRDALPDHLADPFTLPAAPAAQITLAELRAEAEVLDALAVETERTDPWTAALTTYGDR